MEEDKSPNLDFKLWDSKMRELGFVRMDASVYKGKRTFIVPESHLSVYNKLYPGCRFLTEKDLIQKPVTKSEKEVWDGRTRTKNRA